MDKIKIKTKKGNIESMSIDEFSRWMCLVEAFFYIQKKADEKNIQNIFDDVKTMYIEKYIEERYPSIRHDIEMEHMLGNI